MTDRPPSGDIDILRRVAALLADDSRRQAHWQAQLVGTTWLARSLSADICREAQAKVTEARLLRQQAEVLRRDAVWLRTGRPRQ